MKHSSYFNRGSVVKGDIRLLTEIQTRVHLLDVDGLTPTQISERTGLGVSRVSNIKARLRELGFTTLKYRRTKHELREHRAREAAKGEMFDADIVRSKHEPDDDEQPDADEPAFTDIKRCKCGLILPCHHGINDAISLTGSVAGQLADEGEDEPIGYRAGQYDSDRKRKAQKPAGANPARLSATQKRQGLDGTVHVP
jgi:hypothetical protein